MAVYTEIGDVTKVIRTGRGCRLECGPAVVQLSILAPDLIRVQMSPNGELREESWAVSKRDWPEVPFDYQEGPDRITLRGEAVEVRVEKKPLRIAFRRPGGEVFAADAPDGGMAWRRKGVRCTKVLEPKDYVYGLGEKVGCLNKRGYSFSMWNTDVWPHTPSTDPLYKTIPFFTVFRQGKAYGVFFDNTFRSHFDFGKESPDRYYFAADGGQLDYYVFAGPAIADILARYTELTGRMPLPPKWSLGYHQSRFSYHPESEVRDIARQFRERDIPCDVLHLDIHYMDDYRVFTFHPERFPNPRQLMDDLAGQGFKAVTIVDPGVKVDEEYRVYKQGSEKGYFAGYPSGEEFHGSVWPGKSAFPDFIRPEVRKWWADNHQFYLDAGISGIWNDMNEPSVFDTEDKTIPAHIEHGPEDAPRTHAEVHNIYGLQMSRATYEGLTRLRPGRRPWVLTRAAYAGIQRYAAIWFGDNSSWWEHMGLAMSMALNMGMSGVAFVGSDVGGFTEDCSGELLARWTQLGAFTPLFRNHSTLGSRRQEPWAFGEEIEAICRRYIRLRYQLLPYMYHFAQVAAKTGMPIMRALVMDYPEDERVYEIYDQFLVGDFLVAPVHQQGAKARTVYLPRGTWFDFWTGRRYEGEQYVSCEAPLEVMPLFVRAGAFAPLAEVVNYVGEKPPVLETVDVYLTESVPQAKFSLYVDDGETFRYQDGESGYIHFSAEKQGDQVEVRINPEENLPQEYPMQAVRLTGVASAPAEVAVNGEVITASYEADSTRLTVPVGGSTEPVTIRLKGVQLVP